MSRPSYDGTHPRYGVWVGRSKTMALEIIGMSCCGPSTRPYKDVSAKQRQSSRPSRISAPREQSSSVQELPAHRQTVPKGHSADDLGDSRRRDRACRASGVGTIGQNLDRVPQREEWSS